MNNNKDELIESKIVPFETKQWGMLKYLSAEISSETTTIFGE